MSPSDTLTARELKSRGGVVDDLLGFDRSARAFLRTLHRLGPGAVGQAAGGPGSGRAEFLRRCAAVVAADGGVLAGEPPADFFPQVIWYNPWAYAKHGNTLAGLVGGVARPAGAGPVLERARDLTNTLLRMRFDGAAAEGLGAAFSPGEVDPVDRVRRGFATLVEQVRGTGKGRLLILVPDLDQLTPPARYAFFDGLRLLLGGGADVAVVLATSREAVASAYRVRDPGTLPEGGERVAAELVDLPYNVPRVDIRRVALVFRRFLGGGEVQVRRALGEDAVSQLAEVMAWPAVGRPRALERLSARVQLLAEFLSVGGGGVVRLQAAQWAWVVISECWPEFRRFVTRGGRARWEELRQVVVARARDELREPSEVDGWFDRDPDLAEFLGAHAAAFEAQADTLGWIEDTLVAAGL